MYSCPWHKVQFYIVKYKNWWGSECCTELLCIYRELDRTEFFQAFDLMDNLLKNWITFCWPVLCLLLLMMIIFWYVLFWICFLSDFSYCFRTPKCTPQYIKYTDRWLYIFSCLKILPDKLELEIHVESTCSTTGSTSFMSLYLPNYFCKNLLGACNQYQNKYKNSSTFLSS